MFSEGSVHIRFVPSFWAFRDTSEVRSMAQKKLLTFCQSGGKGKSQEVTWARYIATGVPQGPPTRCYFPNFQQLPKQYHQLGPSLQNIPQVER